MVDKKKIFNKVKSVVNDQLDTKKDIKMDTNIKKDLDLDSLDIFEIVDELEDGYDIDIDTDTAGKSMNTVKDFVDYIAKKVSAKKSNK